MSAEAVALALAPTLHLRPLRADDEAAVIALWHACGLTRPWNGPPRDIARKLLRNKFIHRRNGVNGVIAE